MKQYIMFIDLSEKELKDLKNLPAEKVIVTEPTIKKIVKILKLTKRTNLELIGLRNSVVKELTKDDEDDDNWTRMSMITCVIDNEKWKRGMAI